MKSLAARWTSAAAFTLVEVALALGVASFCLITVVALVPLGIDSSQKASDQTEASCILTQVLADLRATPTTTPPGGATKSAEYGIVIPANSTGSSATPVVLYFGNPTQQFSTAPVPGTTRYRLTVDFLPPVNGTAIQATSGSTPSSTPRTATWATLLVSWPPSVDPLNATTGKPIGQVKTFAGLNRN